MTTVSFDGDLHYGNRHTVSVPVRIENLPFLVEAIIDTGAAVSSFDRALLSDLWISDVTAGTEIKLTAANDQRGRGYLHQLHVDVLGHGLLIPVAFCLDWPEGTRNLLGMRGFFEQGIFGFDHRERTMHYALKPSP